MNTNKPSCAEQKGTTSSAQQAVAWLQRCRCAWRAETCSSLLHKSRHRIHFGACIKMRQERKKINCFCKVNGMNVFLATHSLLLLYVISSSIYTRDHEGPLKTFWCLLGSFRKIHFINNSAYTSYVSRTSFYWLCLSCVYLHENRLFGHVPLESYCFSCFLS